MVTIKHTDNICNCCTPEIEIDADNQSTGANIEVDTDVVPVKIGTRPNSYNDLINKPKINGEVLKGDKTGDELGLVDKTTEPNQVYATDDEGKPTTIPYSEEADSEYIVRRDENGDVIVPETPGKDDAATSKKYVDESIDAALEEATVFKGIVDNQTLLPSEGNRNGDMYWIREFVEPVPSGMVAGHSGTAIFNGTLQEFQFESDEIYDPDLKSIHFDNDGKLAVQLSSAEDNIIEFTDNGLYASTSDLEQALQNEIDRATAAEQQLNSDILAEASTREANDEILDGKIDTVSSNLTQEIANRQAADETLQTNIDNEQTRAETAEGQLNTKIEEETTRAQGVEGTLSNLTTDAKTNLVAAINEVDAHTDTITSNVGDLNSLTTDAKNTIVAAINEVDSHTDTNTTNIGTMSSLTTDEKSTLVGAINEVDSHTDTNTSNIGTMSNLTTTEKSSLVGAINELDSSKQDNITGAATTITDNNLTANMVLISNANGKVAADANVTVTELSYIDGATSNIQQQIGTLSSLTTDVKTSLQAAINEIDSHTDTNTSNIGTMTSLTTDAKNTLVAAINEVDSHTDTNTSNIGTLNSLTTDSKDNLVNAINEVDAHTDTNTSNIGTLSNLTTDAKNNLVSAINEIDNHTDTNTTNIGTLSNLTTDAKNNLVAAINEIDSHADTNAGDITTINSKIPSAATSTNQLADKEFVNSSIATNTGNFIGTFNSIAERDAYTGPLTNNDYCFVISTDAIGNTVYNRYKWTTATNPASWQFEYALNNSSFTADQWAAINSGATTTNIGQITTNQNAIGALSSLTTEAKTNLVSAINEVDSHTDTNTSNIGTLNNLTTSAKTDLVSAINELDSSKQDNITGAATTIVSSDLTTNRALVSNASGKVAVSDTTLTELGYVHGVTSSIQTQITDEVTRATGVEGTLSSLTTTAKTDLVSAINELDSDKVEKNTDITGATHTKITYDSKGLVTSGSDITLSDVTDITATAAEVNILDGITASTAELNILDGVTADASELNILDGATLTTTELNYVDGVTSSIQTQLDNKVNKTSTASQVYGTDENGAQTTYGKNDFSKVDDVLVGETSVVTNKIATLGTIASKDEDEYWTIGVQDVDDTQTSYSRKLIKYSADYTNQGVNQQNGFRVLGNESADTGDYQTTGYWLSRVMFGTDKRTFLLGVTKNTYNDTYMCGLGAHSWTDAESQIGAAWEDVYIQPDGNKATYIGGKGWTANSGWFKIQNTGNGDAGNNKVFLNLGTNISPTWKAIQPIIEGAATSITDNNLTASKALVSDANGKVAVSTVTSTELGYVSGVTSSIQTQLDNRVNVKPDGTNNLITNNKVADTYLPDYLFGQMIYAGGFVPSTAVATLTTNAKKKLGTQSDTITLTNNTTPITGYVANEGCYYICTADGTFAGVSLLTGDWLVSTGSAWTKVDNTDAVTGVKGNAETTYRLGNVNITIDNVAPDQTSNNGKFLKTNGTNASWNSLVVADVSDLTATAAELNVLDGITASTTELNYVDGVTSNIQTQLNGKQLTIDSNNKLSSDLVDDTNKTHLFVSSTEKTDWNAKVSDVQVNGTSVVVNNIASVTVPTDTNDLTNGAGFITQTDATFTIYRGE